MQVIEHRGEAVAVVIDGRAILAGGLRGPARRDVQAKALYALQSLPDNGPARTPTKALVGWGAAGSPVRWWWSMVPRARWRGCLGG